MNKLNDPEMFLGVYHGTWVAWASHLGAAPVERLAYHDRGKGYTVDVAYVFRLANGKFALVVEEGRSGYMSKEAKIELFPTAYAALAAYRRWYKGGKGENDEPR